MENKQNVRFEEIISLLNGQITSVKLPVPGKSMEPFLICDRDFIVISALKKKLEVGDIAVFKRNANTYVVHRISDISENGEIMFIGDNELNKEVCRSSDDIVCGVYSAIRKGKVVTPSSFIWIFYRYVWSKMFIRKLSRKLGRIFRRKGEAR